MDWTQAIITICTTVGTILTICSILGKKFDKIDAKFDKIDAKFDKIDAKFDKIDAKFEHMEAKFDKRFDKIETILGEHGERIARIEGVLSVTETRKTGS